MSLSTIFHKLPISGGSETSLGLSGKGFGFDIPPLQGTGTDTSGYLADDPDEFVNTGGTGMQGGFVGRPGESDIFKLQPLEPSGTGGLQACLLPTIITVVTVGVLTLVQLLG